MIPPGMTTTEWPGSQLYRGWLEGYLIDFRLTFCASPKSRMNDEFLAKVPELLIARSLIVVLRLLQATHFISLTQKGLKNEDFR